MSQDQSHPVSRNAEKILRVGYCMCFIGFDNFSNNDDQCQQASTHGAARPEKREGCSPRRRAASRNPNPTSSPSSPNSQLPVSHTKRSKNSEYPPALRPRTSAASAIVFQIATWQNHLHVQRAVHPRVPRPTREGTTRMGGHLQKSSAASAGTLFTRFADAHGVGIGRGGASGKPIVCHCPAHTPEKRASGGKRRINRGVGDAEKQRARAHREAAGDSRRRRAVAGRAPDRVAQRALPDWTTRPECPH